MKKNASLPHQKTKEMTTGAVLDSYYLLENVHLRSTKAGNPFLSGTLRDAAGSVPFVMWDYAGSITPEDAGRVVYVSGTVGEYNGNTQVTADEVALAGDQDDPYIPLSELVPVAPIDIEEAYHFIDDTLVASMFKSKAADLALKLVTDLKPVLLVSPAAKSVHHAFVGGWVMHTSNMLKMAKAVCDVYEESYPVNRALLYAGVVLHDIGKVHEFTLSELGLVKEYSLDGQIFGHSVIGETMVLEKACELGYSNEKDIKLLRHMILSHHGTPEMGAALQPMTLEAEILHYLDGLDSRMEIYRVALDGIPEGEISEYVKALDKRIVKMPSAEKTEG